MAEQIHNIYINSTNKTDNDKNYDYKLYFSNYNIIPKTNDEVFLEITSFQTLNIFYNINDLSKRFTIKIRTEQEINFTYNFDIDTGNYNVYEFMETINSICSDYINLSYNEKKNKWNFTSKQPLNITVYLMPSYYNYKYFGLPPNVFTEILYPINGIGTYSDLINMNSFSLIVIKLFGLIQEQKTLDNFNKTITRGDIIALVNRQDSNINSLINWVDLNHTFKTKINNLNIDFLNFVFYNERNELLTDLGDWLITMKITIKRHLQLQQNNQQQGY
jgi:hypothetical protein